MGAGMGITHHLGPGIIGGMGAGVGIAHHVGDVMQAEGLFIRPRGGDGHVKDLDHGGSQGALEKGGPPQGIIRGNTALFVSRPGQGGHGRQARDIIPHFHSVSDGKDIRVRGHHHGVHFDAAPSVDLKTRLSGEPVFRFNPYGQDDHVAK